MKNHTGHFIPGQAAATYVVTVSNSASGGPTSGTVTVKEAVPTGLTLVMMSGASWTCPAGTDYCTQNNTLPAGSSYPPITVTVSVAANAPSQVTNQVSVSGGGSASAG